MLRSRAGGQGSEPLKSESVQIQTTEELDLFYAESDPWGYDHNADDAERRQRLLSLIPERGYGRVLDIGCGNGIVTMDLPGEEVIGCDLSSRAIAHATERAEQKARSEEHPRHRFLVRSIFDLNPEIDGTFDLIVITGVLYPQYIGSSMSLVHRIIDRVLRPGGVLVHCHIAEWMTLGFPYILIDRSFYAYREYSHRLEVYQK